MIAALCLMTTSKRDVHDIDASVVAKLKHSYSQKRSNVDSLAWGLPHADATSVRGSRARGTDCNCGLELGCRVMIVSVRRLASLRNSSPFGACSPNQGSCYGGTKVPRHSEKSNRK